jgi:hypothetical protein
VRGVGWTRSHRPTIDDRGATTATQRVSLALWRRLTHGRTGFGDPDVFFEHARVPDTEWVTFTVTTTGTEFFDQMTALTGSVSGGLVTLKDASWLLTLSIFHQPKVMAQPSGTRLWWGFLLYPGRSGDFVKKAGKCVQRRGNPGRGAGAPAVRAAARRDHGVVDLYPRRPMRMASGCRADVAVGRRWSQSGRRISAPSVNSQRSYRLHHRVLRPNVVGGSPACSGAVPPTACLSGSI